MYSSAGTQWGFSRCQLQRPAQDFSGASAKNINMEDVATTEGANHQGSRLCQPAQTAGGRSFPVRACACCACARARASQTLRISFLPVQTRGWTAEIPFFSTLSALRCLSTLALCDDFDTALHGFDSGFSQLLQLLQLSDSLLTGSILRLSPL